MVFSSNITTITVYWKMIKPSCKAYWSDGSATVKLICEQKLQFTLYEDSMVIFPLECTKKSSTCSPCYIFGTQHSAKGKTDQHALYVMSQYNSHQEALNKPLRKTQHTAVWRHTNSNWIFSWKKTTWIYVLKFSNVSSFWRGHLLLSKEKPHFIHNSEEDKKLEHNPKKTKNF